MAVTAVPTDGSKLYLGSTADPPVYTEVGHILSITMPGAEVGEVGTDHLNSGGVATFRPGKTDPGEVTFELQYDHRDTQHAALRAMLLDDVKVNRPWRITYPTVPVTGEDFVGFLRTCTPAAQGSDANWEASATIRVSGKFAAYAAS